MYRNPMLNRISWILTIIGSLNWGLVAFAHVDLVRALFGRDTLLARVVYGLVGLGAIWSAYHLFMRTTGLEEKSGTTPEGRRAA